MKNMQPILDLSALYSTRVTLLNPATYWHYWSFRRCSTTFTSLTLSWRTIFQSMTQMIKPKASILSLKTLSRMVLTIFLEVRYAVVLKTHPWDLEHDTLPVWSLHNMEDRILAYEGLESRTSTKTMRDFPHPISITNTHSCLFFLSYSP